MNFNNAEFIRSAVKPSDFLRDGLPQIAFAGRSNVGKSSVINRLLNRNNFARVGSSPGKTTHINYFLIDHQIYFVDLPGYGYAKVPEQEKERWGRLINTWFEDPVLLTFGVMIVDARHKPTSGDCLMYDYFSSTRKPFVVVANKLDKLKNSQQKECASIIRNTLEMSDDVEIIPFSAAKGTGKDQLLKVILNHV